MYLIMNALVNLLIKLVDKLDSLLNIRNNYNLYNLVILGLTPNLFYSLKTVANIRMYAYPWAFHIELASLYIIFQCFPQSSLVSHLHMSSIYTTISQARPSALCTGNAIQRLSTALILDYFSNLDWHTYYYFSAPNFTLHQLSHKIGSSICSPKSKTTTLVISTLASISLLATSNPTRWYLPNQGSYFTSST